jgi:hypothetical protein
MGRRIHVRAVRKKEPNTYLYVLALIELARQLQGERRQQTASPLAPKPDTTSKEASA